MKRLFSTLFWLVTTFFFSFAPLHAQEKDFKTSVVATYTVDNSGTTTVTQNFTVENLTPNVFLTQYTLVFTDPKIANITVATGTQPLTPAITTNSSETTLELAFPDQIVGQNKRREFTITYQTSSLATITGRVLEAHVPVLRNDTSVDQLTIKLITPLLFGRATRSIPEPTSVEINNDQIISTFINQSSETISAFYGSDQNFSLKIRYNLENNGSSLGLAQIALPPDTSFQKMLYQSLEPRPTLIEVDADGNWIATYEVPANATLTPELTAFAQISLDPFPDIPVQPPQSFHTQSQPFWQVGHQQIKDLTTEHTTTKAIYDFVVSSLDYTKDIENHSGNRLGAVESLQQPATAVCQEFSDLFVTMTRAANIPSRRLTGIGYSQDTSVRPQLLEGDVLHAWAEYFDAERNIWVPVDPTWEDTTGGLDYFNQFDLNHIVFAINGKSSTVPYPGGSYKNSNGKSRDVDIEIVDSFPKPEPVFKAYLQDNRFLNFSIPGMYSLAIENQTGSAWYNVTVQAVDTTTNQAVVETKLPIVLPFQTQQLPIQLATQDWQLQNTTLAVKIEIEPYGERYSETFPATTIPQNATRLFDKRLFIGLAISVGVITLTAWGLLVLRQRRQRALRRKSQKP